MSCLTRRLPRAILIPLALVLLLGCRLSPLPPSPTAESSTPTPTILPTTPPTIPPTTPPPTTPLPTAPPTIASTALPTTAPTAPPATIPPTIQPTAQPTSQPAAVAVWEGNITLNTYSWEQGLTPSAPDDPIYPYPHLNFDAVTGPAPRTYQAVFVQNEYVQLTILPELGGRILRWTDRSTGRQLFYANPVIKPTHWGYRGWWLATGGMEWAFPTEEHGLNEYRPWQYELLWNGVRVWDTDDRTGMTVEVTVQLQAGSSRVLISPHITNPTDQAQSYQFWVNGMLTLSDNNAPSPYLTFVLPASAVIVHSTGDSSLPAPGSAMTWPLYNGRDFSHYHTFQSWLGVFAPQAADAGFAGAYDLGVDQGVVRTAPSWVRGVKLFCLGDLGSELWTDDGSRYFEFWGGLTPSFWDYTTLEPGESVGWTETWYAVSGMGGYTYANGEGAVRLTPAGDGVEIAVETTQPVQATIILRQAGGEVTRWQAETGPGQPFRTTWGPGSGPWGVTVVSSTGATIIEYGP